MPSKKRPPVHIPTYHFPETLERCNSLKFTSSIQILMNGLTWDLRIGEARIKGFADQCPYPAISDAILNVLDRYKDKILRGVSWTDRPRSRIMVEDSDTVTWITVVEYLLKSSIRGRINKKGNYYKFQPESLSLYKEEKEKRIKDRNFHLEALHKVMKEHKINSKEVIDMEERKQEKLSERDFIIEALKKVIKQHEFTREELFPQEKE